MLCEGPVTVVGEGHMSIGRVREAMVVGTVVAEEQRKSSRLRVVLEIKHVGPTESLGSGL